MRLAVLQMEARAGDVAANLDLIEAAAAEAAGMGAELLVAPELAVTGYGAGDAMRDLAEPADGAQARRLAAIAERRRLALVAGFAEAEGGRVYNSALLIRPGQSPVTYRKRHLYGDYERALFAAGGDASPIVDVAGLNVSLAVCYDIEFPEIARGLAVAGADLVLVPTALPAGADATFIATRVVPVRAFENQIFVAYADHAGADRLFAYAGLSCISAPDGSDLARAADAGRALLVADVDPASYAASRAANAYLADRRTAFP